MEEYKRLASYSRVQQSVLKYHNIFIRGEAIDVPSDIAKIIDQIRAKRIYPPPSEEEINRIGEPKYGVLYGDENGVETKNLAMRLPLGKSDIRDVFAETLFASALKLGSGGFTRYASKHGYSPTAWELGVEGISRPAPDMLFGSSAHLFSKQGGPAVEHNLAQAREEVHYPFLVVEIDWPLWATEHQCVMGCASCSDIAGKFNDRIQAKKASREKPLETVAFGFISNGTEARLYISWREYSPEAGMVFEVREIDTFLVQSEYLKMRMRIFNIFEWAEERERRLSGILNDIYPTAEESNVEDFRQLNIYED